VEGEVADEPVAGGGGGAALTGAALWSTKTCPLCPVFLVRAAPVAGDARVLGAGRSASGDEDETSVCGSGARGGSDGLDSRCVVGRAPTLASDHRGSAGYMTE
jgi:hypothetical protein